MPRLAGRAPQALHCAADLLLGKAERFIRTVLDGWAYGEIYRSSTERTAALSGWLEFYNWRRPHGALSHKPPGARLAELKRNNAVGSYI